MHVYACDMYLSCKVPCQEMYLRFRRRKLQFPWTRCIAPVLDINAFSATGLLFREATEPSQESRLPPLSTANEEEFYTPMCDRAAVKEQNVMHRYMYS